MIERAVFASSVSSGGRKKTMSGRSIRFVAQYGLFSPRRDASCQRRRYRWWQRGDFEVGYQGEVDCPAFASNGRFLEVSLPVATWTAPEKTRGSPAVCKLSVTARNGMGLFLGTLEDQDRDRTLLGAQTLCAAL